MKLRKSSCTVNDKLTEISQSSGHNDQQQQPVIDDAGSYGADSMETDYMPWWMGMCLYTVVYVFKLSEREIKIFYNDC